MMAMEAVILSIEWNVQIGAGSEPGRAAGSAFQMAADKDDIVITPGGPRERDRVHHVRPGETVRQNKDGTYTIVPKEGPPATDSTDDKKEH